MLLNTASVSGTLPTAKRMRPWPVSTDSSDGQSRATLTPAMASGSPRQLAQGRSVPASTSSRRNRELAGPSSEQQTTAPRQATAHPILWLVHLIWFFRLVHNYYWMSDYAMWTCWWILDSVICDVVFIPLNFFFWIFYSILVAFKHQLELSWAG